MAKENFDFDDLVLPGAPLDLDGETLAAADKDSGEMLAPLAAQPPAEAPAAKDQHDEDQYAKQLRAEDLHVDELRPEQLRAERSEAKESKDAWQRGRSGFWETLSKADLYTVMLGMALAAVAVAVICLLTELASYKFDVKAKEGKAASQKVTWAAQSGCAITTPTA